MGLMKKLHDAFESKDVKAMDLLMADDFIFVRHQSGTQVTKSEMLGWDWWNNDGPCLLYTSPSPRDLSTSRMPSSA